MTKIKKGAYVHIPFCNSKCNYCNFFSRVSSPEIREKYVSSLINQIKAVEDFQPSTLYIGGGTPSSLSPDQIYKILKAFDLSSSFETTVEANPESCTDEFLSAAKEGGADRISMGIQSFSDDELSLCGRKHTKNDAEKAIERIKNAGFENFSADIIAALPSQTEKSLLSSLKQAVLSEIPHISAYILKVEENTVFSVKKIKEQDEDTVSSLYLTLCSFLEKEGYEHYEISNFAKKGFRGIHNFSYWQGKEYLAFGAGAYGYENKTRYHYKPDISEFIEKNGLAEKITDEILTENDIKEEEILLMLRTADGISKKLVPENKENYISELIKNGFMTLKGENLSLTDKGFLVSNTIISELLS